MRNRTIKNKRKERDMSERFRISTHIFALFYPEIRKMYFSSVFSSCILLRLYLGFIRMTMIIEEEEERERER